MKHLKIENSIVCKDMVVLTIIESGKPPSSPISIQTADLLQLVNMEVDNGDPIAVPVGVAGCGVTTIAGH